MTIRAWKERSSRGLAIGAMNQYSTVADALFEIIDNPIDYRRGRHLQIAVEVSKNKDLVVVEDIGGEGMDDEGIDDWLNWGSGHPHERSDIGKYHYGGKAATGFLANHIRIVARRAGTTEIWVFEDREWATRQKWGDWGPPGKITRSDLPIHLSTLSPEAGFARFELRDLSKGRRYRMDDLRFRLSNAYRHLLDKGDISIRLASDAVTALDLPESTAFNPIEIHEKLPSGNQLRGKIWRLDRDTVESSRLIRGGIRTLYNGRLITDNEYFGYYGEGKGLLASLIGELHLNFCVPVPSKNAWVTDSTEWYEVQEAMNRILPPIIKEFRDAAEKNPVSREEKKLANDVHRQLLAALKLLSSEGSPTLRQGELTLDEHSEGGRMAAEDRGDERSQAQGGVHGPIVNRTPPPEDPVGKLQRLVKAGGLPPIRPKPIERHLRSIRDLEEEQEVIVVNTIHNMYKDCDDGAGRPAYVAETAILEALLPEDNEPLVASEYHGQALQLLNAWYRVIASGR